MIALRLLGEDRAIAAVAIDAAQIKGDVTMRLGRDGESYPGIRKDEVHVGGRIALADSTGPFGNPTSDSARTMVTTATTRAPSIGPLGPRTVPDIEPEDLSLPWGMRSGRGPVRRNEITKAEVEVEK